MVQLNRVELTGIVGSVRIQSYGDNKMARVGLATNYAYKDRDGAIVLETTWHNVVLWEGKGICDLSQLTKGTPLRVSGRLRNQEYTDQEGNRRTYIDVYANQAEIIELERGERLEFEEQPGLRVEEVSCE